MKKIISFFLLFFILFPTAVHAQEKFTTSLNSTYNIYEKDPAEVIWDFKIKNKTSDFIVSNYQLFVNYPDAFNISVTDSKGKVDFNSKKQKDGISLKLNFENKVAGINREKIFQIKFNSKNIYRKIGSSQEININKIPDDKNYTEQNSQVNLPDTFPQDRIIKPVVINTNLNKLNFNNLDSSIKIIGGTERIYDLILTYHLYNQNLFKRKTEIAIPQDTAYQSIYILDISPKPINVRMDEDGNYLASYQLKPSQKLEIEVREKIKVNLSPIYPETYNLESNSLVRERKYWEVNHPKIKKIAKQKSVPEIYNYILENLTYESTKESRSGAVYSFSNPNFSSSADFADSLVALTRAGDVPARVIQGFIANDSTLTSKHDLLHVWAEYFDSELKQWRMTDTALTDVNGLDYLNSMDLDHITFSTLGIDSEKPNPAGTYKITNTKDVNVKVSEQFGLPKPQLKIRPEFETQYGGLKIKGKIYFKNLTGAKINSQSFNLSSENLSPDSQDLIIPIIPPYGEVAVKSNFSAQPFLTKETDTFKITLGQNVLDGEIQIVPIYQNRKLIILGIGVLIIVTTIGLFRFTRRARNI